MFGQTLIGLVMKYTKVQCSSAWQTIIGLLSLSVIYATKELPLVLNRYIILLYPNYKIKTIRVCITNWTQGANKTAFLASILETKKRYNQKTISSHINSAIYWLTLN